MLRRKPHVQGPSGRGQDPSEKAAAERFRGEEETARLNVEIPKALRCRIKAWCAVHGREMKDVVRERLEELLRQPGQAIRTRAAELLKPFVPRLIDQLRKEFKDLDRATAVRLLSEELNNLECVLDDEA